jgi:hypothetical protein
MQVNASNCTPGCKICAQDSKATTLDEQHGVMCTHLKRAGSNVDITQWLQLLLTNPVPPSSSDTREHTDQTGNKMSQISASIDDFIVNAPDNKIKQHLQAVKAAAQRKQFSSLKHFCPAFQRLPPS